MWSSRRRAVRAMLLPAGGGGPLTVGPLPLCVSVLLLLLVLLLLYQLHRVYWPHFRLLPPGPFPWPFLGNLWQLERCVDSALVFRAWARRFGPLFTYWTGGVSIVAVADVQLAKEMFVRHGANFLDRFPFAHINRHARGGPNFGLLLANGRLWRENRKFAMKVFKDVIGTDRMEQIVSAACLVVDARSFRSFGRVSQRFAGGPPSL